MSVDSILSPPAANAYLFEVVPFTSTTGVLSFLMLWEEPYGSSSVPLQILQYSPASNTLVDNTSTIFVGAVPSIDNPRNVALIDLNNDGASDIVIANQGLDQSPFPGTTDTLLISTPSGQLVNASSQLPTSLAYSHDVSSGVIDKNGDKGVFFNNIYSQANNSPYYLVSCPANSFT